MNKAISAIALCLVVAISASAKPNPPLFESRSESLKIAMEAFVSGHFGTNTPFSLPSPKEMQADNNPADLSRGTFSLSPFTWSGRDHSISRSLHVDYVSAYVTDLQSFLLTQHIDATTLQDLKLWISQLPVDARAIKNFEGWVQKQDFGSSASSFGTNQSLAAVPEPNTVITFLCGIGLLSGVLLRRRYVRRRSITLNVKR